MYLYVIFLSVAFCSFMEVGFNGIKYSRSKIYSGIFVIFTLVFILYSSLRWERGTDWISYYNYFLYNNSITTKGLMEPGFTLFTSISNVISDSNYTFQLFLIALITISLKAKVIKKLSIYPFLSLLVWLSIYIGDIFAVRQAIAASITFFSLIFIVEKRIMPFILCVLLASTIHTTSLIFLPAYYIFNLKIKRINLILLIVISYLVAIVFSNKLATVIDLIHIPMIREKIDTYLEFGSEVTFNSAYSLNQIIIRGFINKLIIFIPVFTYLWKLYDTDKLFSGLVNLIVIGTVLTVLVMPVNIALARIGVYMDVIMQILLIPYLLKIKVNQRSRILMLFILCFYLFYRYNGVITNYKELYIPYKSIFDK